MWGSFLELGAGAGLPSLTAASNGARRVVITDYPEDELLETLQWNVHENLTPEQQAVTTVQVHLLFLSHTGSRKEKGVGRPRVEDASSCIFLTQVVVFHALCVAGCFSGAGPFVGQRCGPGCRGRETIPRAL